LTRRPTPELRELCLRSLECRAVDGWLAGQSRAGVIGTLAPVGDAQIELGAQVAVGLACAEGDLLWGTRRDLPAALARGVSLEVVFGQALGRAADPSLGRGLPGAIHDRRAGVILSDGGPAAHLVHAAGFGHAARLSKSSRCAVALFGSAAWAHGEMHAALNFAAVGRAATVFVARGPRAGEPWLDEVAFAWGLSAERVPGDDGMAVLRAVREARERVSTGEGPALIDARLDAPARPLDLVAFRDAGGFDEVPEATLMAEIHRKIEAAWRAALAAEPVAAETITAELLAPGGTTA
jgi:TPP-dependent pyruvate/acetoin dehydrogenase alpha subunit